LGFAQLMRRDLTMGKEQQEKINIIHRSGNHLLSLINGILDFAKIESGKEMLHLRSFNLSVFLKEIEELFQSRMIDKGLFFALEKDDDLPRYIKSDEGKLRQVLINLIGNAIKFTETGGVTLSVRADALTENIQTLHIEVEDTGIGIDSNQMGSIFDPFVQAGHIRTDSQGTGLGLAICKSFVELLKGEISVESKLGKGSMFRIELEVALAEAAEAKSIEIAKPTVLGLEPGQTVRRILVVEDNAENRLLLNSLLVQAGFDTRQAENGEEAVTLFEQWQPHFIWMDIRMPVMDGYQATAKIRSLPGGDTVKIVAITASAFGEQRSSILEAGCNEVMHKPYQPHEIFETMRAQLGVRYVYEEEIDKSPSSAEKGLDIKLAKEMADSLPKPLLNELKKSSTALDIEETYKVIERIAEIQPELAGVLRMYVEELDFSAIKNILNHE
jgi:CheY-like chemotaxis protein/anti-sigma regulatory factor (Ser/Thr protein kinase)